MSVAACSGFEDLLDFGYDHLATEPSNRGNKATMFSNVRPRSGAHWIPEIGRSTDNRTSRNEDENEGLAVATTLLRSPSWKRTTRIVIRR